MQTRERQIELIAFHITRFNYPTQPIEQLDENRLRLMEELKSLKFKNSEEAKSVISNIEKTMNDYIEKVRNNTVTVDDRIIKDNDFIELFNFVKKHLQVPSQSPF